MKGYLAQHWNLPPTWLRFLVIVLLILGVFFRFANLDKKVYWHDESYTSLRISGYTQAEVIRQVFNGDEIESKDLQTYQHTNPHKKLSDTLYVLAVEAPHHPPLYYLMARFWIQLLGSSVAVTRSLSAFISLFTFPGIYWLCLELFESSLAGWVGVALIAVSPFHLLYAQEAREYSLWTAIVLLSSAALLRAIRLQTKQSWIIYSAILVLGFYTHAWFSLVALGHGFYVAGCKLNEINFKIFRLPNVLNHYLLATGFALLTFIPWILIIIRQMSQIRAATAWVDDDTFSLINLTKNWILQLSSIFLDLNGNIFFALDYGEDKLLTYLIRLPVLILSIYSIYILCCTTRKKVWWFILTLIGVTGLTLMLPDLILGWSISTVSRYLIPCYLGVQLSVIYLLSTKTNLIYHKIWKQKFWHIVMAALLSVEVLSCLVNSQAEVWWNKYSGIYNLKVAHIVNQSHRPLLIGNDEGDNFGNLLSLSYLLKPIVKLQLAAEANKIKIKSDFSDIFLYNPSQAFHWEFENKRKYRVEPVYKLKKYRELWRIKK